MFGQLWAQRPAPGSGRHVPARNEALASPVATLGRARRCFRGTSSIGTAAVSGAAPGEDPDGLILRRARERENPRAPSRNFALLGLRPEALSLSRSVQGLRPRPACTASALPREPLLASPSPGV